MININIVCWYSSPEDSYKPVKISMDDEELYIEKTMLLMLV